MAGFSVPDFGPSLFVDLNNESSSWWLGAARPAA
jgi:hypothetical protein